MKILGYVTSHHGVHLMNGATAMLSSHERRKLMEEMRNESMSAIGVLLKCAAGLLIVVGLSWIGTTADGRDDVARHVPAAERNAQVRTGPVISAQNEAASNQNGAHHGRGVRISTESTSQ